MRNPSAAASGAIILEQKSRWIAPLLAVIAPFTATAAAEVSGTPEASARTGGHGSALEEIIVTAQRREENLQRAAVSVSAVVGDDVVAAGVSDTVNLNKLVPALQVQPSGGGLMSFFLRGVGTLQSNSYGENPIAYNFNGVYVARPSAPAGAFYDLERIEVVKGPQGTLYGRNATGGAINVLPKRPSLGDLSGDVTLEYGSEDSKKVLGAINVPMGEAAALRLAGQWVDRDGYLSDGYDDEEGKALRASLLLKPGERWSALLVADYFHQGGKGLGSVLVPSSYMPTAPDIDQRIGGADARSVQALRQWGDAMPAPPFCPGGLVSSGCVLTPLTDGYIDSTFYGVSATIEADLGFAGLTVIPAYRRSEPSYRMYFTGFLGEVSEKDDQYSLEVRLASDGEGRFGYVLGAYLFDEHQETMNFFNQGTVTNTRFNPELDTRSQAVFGQATFHVSEVFRFVGGLRYTDEKREQEVSLASGGPGNPNPPLSQPPFSGELNFDGETWKVGLEWDVADDSLVYANVATGFKAGGFFVAAPPNDSFDEEKLTAYTIGSKNRLLDNRVQANVEAFYWEYEDQQISFVGGIDTPTGVAPGGVTVNAGRANMYGAELELTFAPTANDRFGTTLQYLQTEYDSLVFDALSPGGAPIRTGCTSLDLGQANPGTPDASRRFRIDCSGNPTLNSPEWTTNLNYEHLFTLGAGYGLAAGIRARIESSRELAIDYLLETSQGSYTTTDIYLELKPSSERWSLAGFVNNIEDETVKSSVVVRPVLQPVYASLRPPRTYGVRFGYYF